MMPAQHIGIDVAGSPSSSSLLSRVLALPPYTWSGRSAALPYILTVEGGLSFIFGTASLAGVTGQDLTLGWKLLWLVAGGYHAIVGGVAIREHLASAGDQGERFAWSNAAAYALCVPSFVVGALLLVGQGLQPFPPKSSVISGPVDRFWADEITSSEAVYRLRLRGDNREFDYDCTRGRRSGWCNAHDALETAAQRLVTQADVIAMNGEIVGLGLDGQNLVNWDDVHFWKRIMPLAFGALTGLVSLRFIADAVGWTRRALSARADVARTNPNIIE